jgi:hypothetical protein
MVTTLVVYTAVAVGTDDTVFVEYMSLLKPCVDRIGVEAPFE